MAVIGGGIALGLIASRFLKASQGERYRSQSEQRFSRDTQLQQQPSAMTGYSMPTSAGTGMSATPDNELSSGVTPDTPQRPQTPATAPVTGGI